MNLNRSLCLNLFIVLYIKNLIKTPNFGRIINNIVRLVNSLKAEEMQSYKKITLISYIKIGTL